MPLRLDSPIFIVGPHRAGSTLWHNLIAMDTNILRLADPRFLGRPGQRDFKFFLDTQVRDLSTDEDVDLMVDLCFSRKTIAGLEGAFWRFEGITGADDPELRQEVARRVKQSNRSLGSVVKIILEELTRFSGRQRCCMKFPVDVMHIPSLVEWFPDCKIIHITRDPRGLAMSKSNDPSGTAIKTIEHPRLAWFIRKASVAFTIFQYRLAAKQHVRFSPLKNYRLFRYEDLLAEPEKTLKELCAFIEIDFTPAMLEPEKGRHEHQPSSLTGRRKRGFDPAAATRWQTVIAQTDYWLISCSTKTSMKKLGYNPKTHPIFRKVNEVSSPAPQRVVS
jgi:hypothetical protein